MFATKMNTRIYQKLIDVKWNKLLPRGIGSESVKTFIATEWIVYRRMKSRTRRSFNRQRDYRDRSITLPDKSYTIVFRLQRAKRAHVLIYMHSRTRYKSPSGACAASPHENNSNNISILFALPRAGIHSKSARSGIL